MNWAASLRLAAAMGVPPDAFWRETAQRIDWMKPFTQIDDVSWDKDDLHIRWFADGTLNASVNCIDIGMVHISLHILGKNQWFE